MNRIERAEAKALAAQKRLGGVPLTLTRGATSVAITGIPGSTPVSVENGEGLRVRVFTQDWLIDLVDYDFGDGPVEPAIGDVIAAGDGTFEVASLGGSEPAWRWHDRQRTRYRVHTVET